MEKVTLSRSFYITVAETAAQHEGMLSAREVAEGATFYQPGDPLGSVLCETWLIDEGLVSMIAAAYVSAFQSECEKQGVGAPALGVILGAIPRAIDEARSPAVDFAALSRVSAAEVPRVL